MGCALSIVLVVNMMLIWAVLPFDSAPLDGLGGAYSKGEVCFVCLNSCPLILQTFQVVEQFLITFH
jgi:hypothetical protein